jgi:hypothetical protein
MDNYQLPLKGRVTLLIREAEKFGLTITRHRPGDSKTRWRFFDREVSSYNEAGSLYTAIGVNQAYTWFEGFKAGKFFDENKKAKELLLKHAEETRG